MAKQSTNKWALERMRESVNVLLKKSGTEPLLVEVLSDLLWVVDHQQSELERMYDWTKYIIEQALVDHAHGDGTVQINESCHEAIKAWNHTDGINGDGEPTQPARMPVSFLGHIFIGDATHPDDVVWEPWDVFEELLATHSRMVIFTGRGYPDGSGWVGVQVRRDEPPRWFRREATDEQPHAGGGDGDARV